MKNHAKSADDETTAAVSTACVSGKLSLGDPVDRHYYDLFWHALNYRGASTEHAEFFWKELEACVERLVERARDWRNE